MSLIVQDLSKSFAEKSVLRDISFEFEDGKIYALLGRNGAGKTTFFNCLIGNLSCEKGRFFLKAKEAESVDLREEDVALVESAPEVPSFLTGWEFIRFLLAAQGLSAADFMARYGLNGSDLAALFEHIGLDETDRHKLIKDYSHGMKSKLLLLANLLLDTPVLLLDEPLSSVDVLAAEEMKAILRQHKAQRVTILSTHIMDLALSLCDEVVLLQNGQLRLVPRGGQDDAVYRETLIQALRGEVDHA